MHISLKHHPFGRCELSVWTFPCVEKFRSAPACIRSDVSVACPDDSQCSIKLQDFFPKHRYGKIAATVRTTWIPVRTCSSIRQVSQFKFRRPDASQHGPTRVHQIWKLHAPNQPSGLLFPRFGCAKPLYGNYLQWTCDHPNDRAPSSVHGSFQERFSAKFLEFRSHSCPS
jgi:hypothetical protein